MMLKKKKKVECQIMIRDWLPRKLYIISKVQLQMYIFTYIYCKEAAVFCTICPFLLLIKFAFFIFLKQKHVYAPASWDRVKFSFVDILVLKLSTSQILLSISLSTSTSSTLKITSFFFCLFNDASHSSTSQNNVTLVGWGWSV